MTLFYNLNIYMEIAAESNVFMEFRKRVHYVPWYEHKS